MGLLDSVLGQALGSLTGGAKGGNNAALVAGVMEMLGGQPGGVEGLQKQFQQAGLGEAVNSWISTGKNQAISPADLTKVLGQGRIDQIAHKAGVVPGNGASILAQLLPIVIDQLTPHGKAPAQGQLGQLGADLLKGLLGGGQHKA